MRKNADNAKFISNKYLRMGNSLHPTHPIIYLIPSWSFLLKNTLSNMKKESKLLHTNEMIPISFVIKDDIITMFGYFWWTWYDSKEWKSKRWMKRKALKRNENDAIQGEVVIGNQSNLYKYNYSTSFFFFPLLLD